MLSLPEHSPDEKMMHKPTILAAVLLYSSAWAAATALPSVRFEHKDWEIACDNTRTCRAAGYHKPEDQDDSPVSVLLTRAAGPGQPVKAYLQIGDDPQARHAVPAQVQMKVDGKHLGTVAIVPKTHVGALSARQAAALLPALLKGRTIAWIKGQDAWTLSTAGATAVLLKMDEFQGRLGTPGALVRPGTRAESQALPPLATPVLTAPLPAPAQADNSLVPPGQQAALVDALRKVTPADECDLTNPALTEPFEQATYPLPGERMLVERICWHGPYGLAFGYWIAGRHPPYAPSFVIAGATGYDDGTIYRSKHGSGNGDCMANDSWTWNGEAFVHTGSATSGMCRGITAGGAWYLPTLVTTIKKQP
jgi:invasion protein IalB